MKCKECGIDIYNDSDMPVTPEWLEEAGFKVSRPMIGAWAELGRNVYWLTDEHGRHVLQCEASTLIDKPTRGQVRQLCAALGIELPPAPLAPEAR